MADLTGMLQAAAGVGGEYQISRSLRFNSADDAYLSRTPASAGNRKTWTWSGWVKRSLLGGSTDATGYRAFFSAYSGNNDYISIDYSRLNESIRLSGLNSSVFSGFETNPLYRDVSAWYHVVIALDTTQATASDRFKCYVNGSLVTFSSSTNPSLNEDFQINNTVTHGIGRNIYPNFPQRFDGYLADINFIDGQALTPSSFGKTNPTTGVWQPKAYTGTYGTNGFYLNFSDNSNTTASTLGKDYSGNGNNWTPNNFSVTAGAGNDSLVDTPTPYGTDTGAGGEVRGNYCTLNPLTNTTGRYTVSNGNLQIVATNAFNAYVASTVSLPETGKYYFEYVCTNTGGNSLRDSVGFVKNGLAQTYLGNSNTLGYEGFTGTVSGVATGSYSTWGNGDVVGVAVDCDTGRVWFAKNNTWQNSGSPTAGTGQVATLISITDWIPAFGAYAASEFSYTTNGFANFGQRPFAYTAPSGFKALVTTNLPDPTVVQGDDYFNTVLYTGTGSSQSITGVGFQPDWVWIKQRNSTGWHNLVDAVRGSTKYLFSNATDAEATETDRLTAFNSDGFSVSTYGDVNANGSTYVAWNWKANGAGVSNTAGTITSTVSVNTTSGFSIVTYTGTGSAATVGHGLGAVPRMIIVKNRDQADAWQVYHAANTANPETDYLVLNTTAATADAADRWNDTLPTSTVFSIGNGVEVNTNTEKYVAYCFAEVEGFSKFGSYTGNGSADGPFVYTGFRPAFVMLKRTDSTSNWTILDLKREGYNVDNDPLYPNLSNAEGTTDLADLLSNGFKLRSTDASVNASGGNYVFAAFSSNPFKFALAR